MLLESEGCAGIVKVILSLLQGGKFFTRGGERMGRKRRVRWYSSQMLLGLEGCAGVV